MTEAERLPQSVIEEDHQLESAAEHASTALMELRWHWTLDESNPERVSCETYGKGVNLKYTVIYTYAAGFALLRNRNVTISPSEAIFRANASAEKEAVIDAVAQARSQAFTYVANTRGSEVRHVRELARERAEERGTSVEEEAQKLAQMIVKAERAEQNTEDERRQRHELRYFELDGYLASALRYLAKADKLAGTISWDDEERELLAHVIDQVKRLTHRIDQRIAGVKEIDWDAELEEILAKSGS